MRLAAGTLFIVMASASFASAASLTNKDGTSQMVVVTEDGVRSELAIASGETVTACDSGVFSHPSQW